MTDELLQKSLTPPIPPNETERLSALHRYKILDTPPEAAFDRITTLVARLFKMPIVLISLVDESRAWFKSCIGFDAREVPRNDTLCSFAVLTDEPLIIPDTRLDERFACNPFVQSEPGVRFYAGAPLLSHDGFNLGTLCLLDTQPHAPLTAEQQATLVDLAAMVVDELELRLAAHKIAQVDAALLEITQGVSIVTGSAFLDALVQHFAKVLDTDYVYIGLVEGDDPKQLRTIATLAQGQIVDNLTYPLQDTPCWEVIGQRKICCYPRNVQAHFPNAPLLKPLSIESYIAAPFFDSNGTPLGLLGVMDGKPLENVYLAESLLTIFANRIATELERQQAEAALRESEEKYRTVLTSMDEGFLIAEVVFNEGGEAVDYRCLEVNSAFYTQTGLSTNIVGQTMREIAPDTPIPWLSISGQVVKSRSAVRFESDIEIEQLRGYYDVQILPLGEPAEHRVAVLLYNITERKQTEELRRRSEEMFSALVENAPFGVYLIDSDFRLREINSGSRAVFSNISPLIGRDFAEILRILWPEPFATEAIKHFLHTLATGESYLAPPVIEKRHNIQKTESYDWQIHRITLPDGRYGVVCYFYDLTEIKRAEKIIRQAAERDAFLVVLADSLRPLANPMEIQATASRVLGEYLGANRVAYFEVRGANYVVERDYVNGAEALAGSYSVDSFGPKLLAAYRTGRAVSAFNVEADPNLSPTQRSAYAALQISAYIGIPLVKDGEFVAGLAIHTSVPRVWTSDEVTLAEEVAERTWAAVERVRAEATLRESEEKLSLFIEHAPAAIAMFDREMRYLGHSQRWMEDYKLTENIIGRSHYEVFPEISESWKQIHQNGLAGAVEKSDEDRFDRLDGSVSWLKWEVRPWFNASGEVGGIIIFAENITERKQADLQLQQQANELIELNVALEQTASKLSERNQELDRFVYTVSHDLKAPLRAIYNLSSWIADDLEGQLDEENLHQMQLLQSRVVRMEALINGLLAYSRIGRTEIVTERVKVDELLWEILDSLTFPSTFTIFVQPEMPTLVTARLLLSQVFSNLISNAIKYNDRANGQIEIRANQKGEYYEFSVTDNGPGIAPENHQRVFDIFQTLKGQEVPESTGIGLSIVKKIIETEGGSIVLESNLGEGATFRFTWGNRHGSAKTAQ